MDAMQSYFELGMATGCGIPSVTLEGTADDWSRLHDKTEELGRAYSVKWWTDRMLPIMERIARNSAGADDPDLWRRIYKVDNNSGGPYIGGWIRRFFPYIVTHDYREWKSSGDKPRVELVRNKWLDEDDEPKMFTGMSTADFPPSLSKVPLTWLYLGEVFEMESGSSVDRHRHNLYRRQSRGWSTAQGGSWYYRRFPVTRIFSWR
jgi:hypothetical protein